MEVINGFMQPEQPYGVLQLLDPMEQYMLEILKGEHLTSSPLTLMEPRNGIALYHLYTGHMVLQL